MVYLGDQFENWEGMKPYIFELLNPNMLVRDVERIDIAELQIEPNKNGLLENLEGSIFAWFFVTCLVVMLAKREEQILFIVIDWPLLKTRV